VSLSTSDALRLESRNGIPQEVRSIAWQLLLGYLPSDTLLHTATLDDKRRQYRRLIRKHYSEKRLPSQVPPEQQQQQQQQPPPSVNDVLDSVLGPDAVLSAPPLVIPTSTSEEALGSADAARLEEVAMMSVIGSAAFLQCESKFRLRDASRRELHAQIHVDVIRSVPENLERVFENLIVQEVRRHDHGRTMWLPHQVSLILIIVIVIVIAISSVLAAVVRTRTVPVHDGASRGQLLAGPQRLGDTLHLHLCCARIRLYGRGAQ